MGLDPPSYRILLMLPSVYRLWAKIRLKHMQPWISSWTTPQVFAGAEGHGAADAAYETTISMEMCRLKGEV